MRERGEERRAGEGSRGKKGGEGKVGRIPKEIYKLYDSVTKFAQKAKHINGLNLLGKA